MAIILGHLIIKNLKNRETNGLKFVIFGKDNIFRKLTFFNFTNPVQLATLLQIISLLLHMMIL